jgi:hypothetical protein
VAEYISQCFLIHSFCRIKHCLIYITLKRNLLSFPTSTSPQPLETTNLLFGPRDLPTVGTSYTRHRAICEISERFSSTTLLCAFVCTTFWVAIHQVGGHSVCHPLCCNVARYILFKSLCACIFSVAFEYTPGEWRSRVNSA